MDRVTAQLDELVARLREILGENLVGIYLHGSLALGCFNPTRSDLDLLIVIHTELTPRSRFSLIETFLSLSGHPAPVEISVIKDADLHPWRHPCPYIFHYSESWRARLEAEISSFSTLQNREILESEPATDPDLAGHITVLRARGRVLSGAPIAEVFPEVPRADFLDSVLGDVLSPEFGLLSETIDPVYAILNGCRTLAYLRGGGVLSKAEGGQWALENLPAEYQVVVQNALSAYQCGGEMPTPSLLPVKRWLLGAIESQKSTL